MRTLVFGLDQTRKAVWSKDKRADARSESPREMQDAYARPYVLTQRTPVLRGGNMLSLLGAALLRAALLSCAAFLCAAFFRAAFLCSCHSVCFSFPLDFYPVHKIM